VHHKRKGNVCLQIKGSVLDDRNVVIIIFYKWIELILQVDSYMGYDWFLESILNNLINLCNSIVWSSFIMLNNVVN